MPERQLTEASWKAFAKGRSYKDAPLLKALAALLKAEKEGAQPLLDALDDVDDAAQSLLKGVKGDKELSSYVTEMGKAVEKSRTQAKNAMREDANKAKAAAKKADAEEEEEEEPALIGTKMLPLIRQVKNGGGPFPAMCVTDGKVAAVLVSRTHPPQSRRKMLMDYLGLTGGVKCHIGECMFEDKVVTFVFPTQPAGLAKKIRMALFNQIDMRVKVRVRGENPEDIDEDLTEEGKEGYASGDGDASASDDGDKSAKTAEAASAGMDRAMGEWRTARNMAVTLIQTLARDIAAAKLPQAVEGITLATTVARKLSVDPKTAAAVAELIDFVDQDPVVKDISDIEQDIRTPLKEALEGLRQALAT